MIHSWYHISIIKNWNIFNNIPIDPIYRIWTIIPYNNMLYVFALNIKTRHNQLLEIDLRTNSIKLLITYNQTDGVRMCVFINNEIHCIMNII